MYDPKDKSPEGRYKNYLDFELFCDLVYGPDEEKKSEEEPEEEPVYSFTSQEPVEIDPIVLKAYEKYLEKQHKSTLAYMKYWTPFFYSFDEKELMFLTDAGCHDTEIDIVHSEHFSEAVEWYLPIEDDKEYGLCAWAYKTKAAYEVDLSYMKAEMQRSSRADGSDSQEKYGLSENDWRFLAEDGRKYGMETDFYKTLKAYQMDLAYMKKLKQEDNELYLDHVRNYLLSKRIARFDKTMLICPNCGTEFPITWRSCPNCRYRDPLTERPNHNKVWFWTAVLSVALISVMVAGTMVADVKQKKYQEACAETMELIREGKSNLRKYGSLLEDVWYNSMYKIPNERTDPFTQPNGWFVVTWQAIDNLTEDPEFISMHRLIIEYQLDAEASIRKLEKKLPLGDEPDDGIRLLYLKFDELSEELLQKEMSYQELHHAMTADFQDLEYQFREMEKNPKYGTPEL